MQKQILIIFSSVILLIGQTYAKKPSQQIIEVQDFAGNSIVLERPAQRIIALAPHIVENVFSAGAGQHLVGVVRYSDFPAAAKALPIVGDYYGMNYEIIRQLQPDLILAWESGNDKRIIQRLKQMGYPVYLDHPHSLGEVAKSIRDIGTLTGKELSANRAAQTYLKELDRLTKENHNKTPISVFYQVWHQPLQTVNGEHIISDAIRICQGVNIFADAQPLAPLISKETLLLRNPQVILTSGMAKSHPEWLKTWQDNSALQAAQKNHLFFIEPNHIQRHTVRMLLGTRTLCQQLDLVRESLNEK